MPPLVATLFTHYFEPMNKPHIALSTFALVLASFCLAGCQESSTCASLRDHGDSCDFAAGRYVGEASSVCENYRTAYGEEKFEAFAGCITASPCDDPNAVTSCQQMHLPLATTSACERFTLWSVGCGLEPATSGPTCGGLATGLAEPSFTRWVDCVTKDGCPRGGDTRYEQCQIEILAPPLSDRLTICNKLNTWAQICGPSAPADLPIDFNLVQCMATGQVFTDESYNDYADCLLDMADSNTCNSRTERVLCNLRLVPMDNSAISALCSSLVQFGELCPGPITGNSEIGCGQTFSRFTLESFEAYVNCITGVECDQNADFSPCLPLLEFTR